MIRIALIELDIGQLMIHTVFLARLLPFRKETIGTDVHGETDEKIKLESTQRHMRLHLV